MQLNPYLSFDGQCEAAFKFYEQVLGGKITFMQKWGDSPACEGMPAEARDSIMHATLQAGYSIVMGADSPPGHYEQPKSIHIAINLSDPAEGERIFKALSEGGNIEMPYQETFFSSGFGMCGDRFGILWMVHTQQAGATAGS